MTIPDLNPAEMAAALSAHAAPLVPDDIQRKMSWEWLKTWQVREWLTLFFAAAAAAAPWVVHRSNRRNAAKAEAANWSIEIRKGPLVGEEFLRAELRLENYEENRFTLIELTAKKPRGLRVTGINNNAGRDGRPLGLPDPSVPTRSLRVNRELAGSLPPFPPGGQSRFPFLLKMPTRPWYRRAPSIRALIEATVEEISANRRVMRIAIKTPPIEWTISKNASAT
jgi:hypothetical protein